MTIRELLTAAVEKLACTNVPDPRPDAEWLLCSVLGKSRMELLLDSASEVSAKNVNRYQQLIEKRCTRVPLQYLLGEESFYGLDYYVDSRVLIPRPETEILCEKALEMLKDVSRPRVLDLCTGSGAIAVTIKTQRPDADVFACDLSPDAMEVARRNAAHHHAEITFCAGDLFKALQQKNIEFDAILSNPPYISKEDCRALQPEVSFEPMMALEAGEDGLVFYRRIAEGAGSYLSQNGFLMMELGDGEGGAVKEILLARGYRNIGFYLDLSGKERIIVALRPIHL